MARNVHRSVPNEKAFYFFEANGQYTGVSAKSLEEFMERVRSELSSESVEFHVERQDFEKWISGVFGDEKLAEEIRNIRLSGVKGETLRRALHVALLKKLRRTR